jgi:molybdopterin-guanine dinucleotide biosynthesis protein A
MLKSKTGSTQKPSAKAALQYTDKEIVFNGEDFDFNLDEIRLINGIWAYKMQATAIIMAGGKSKRMGCDKAMLPINGKSAIEHIFEQLRPHFESILISSNDKDKQGFLDADIVTDEATGKGPLMGIASALRASTNEVNFIIACDIPQVDIGLVKQMIRDSRNFDAVIPRSAGSRYEPLFAVYKKSIVDVLDKALTKGNYRIVDALSHCNVNYLDLPAGREIRNLNTMADYEDFCRD